jgi:modification methylase
MSGIKDIINNIILGDSLEILKAFPEKSVHLIVTSPPYPMFEMWDEMFNNILPPSTLIEDRIGNECSFYNAWAYFLLLHDYLLEIWTECKRILIDGGILCINIGDACRTFEKQFCMFPNHSEIINKIIFDLEGFTSLVNILWKKPTNKPNAFLGAGFIPCNSYVTLDCEYILLFRKGENRKFNKEESERRKQSRFTKDERDKWFSQIWEINGASNKDGLAAFPEEIPYRLIRMFSIEGDIVLDPFCGSGTTCKVAKDLNRNYIGIDIKDKCIEKSQLRLKS